MVGHSENDHTTQFDTTQLFTQRQYIQYAKEIELELTRPGPVLGRQYLPAIPSYTEAYASIPLYDYMLCH